MFKIYGDGFEIGSYATLAEATAAWGNCRGLYEYRKDFVYVSFLKEELHWFDSPITQEQVYEIDATEQNS